MNPTIAELLAQDISNRIGVRAHASQNFEEALQNVKNGLDSLPCAELVSTTTAFVEPSFFEVHLADGTVEQRHYDIDHIPIESIVGVSVFTKTAQDTDDLAHSIQSMYAGSTDAGVLMLPIDGGSAHAAVRYRADQLRPSVKEGEGISWTIINSADGIKAPMPYPQDDLRASLSDRTAIARLFIAYFYYMYILSCDVPGKIAKDYSKLFAAPTKASETKKGLFNKLRENQFTSSILDSGVAQKLTGENITKLTDAIQAGTLDKTEFDAFFDVVLPVVPDLYERAMRHESADAVLAAANAKLGEVQQRAEAIANSLGIEQNPAGNENYQPRSLEAAAIYIKALGIDSELKASAPEILEVYRLYVEKQAADAQAMQDELGNMVADALDNMGGNSSLAKNLSSVFRK